MVCRSRQISLVLSLAATACADAPAAASTSGGLGGLTSGPGVGSSSGAATSDSAAATTTTPSGETTQASTTGPEGETSTGSTGPRECALLSTGFGDPMQELDVDPGSTTRLSFSIPDVPANPLRATLRFESHDADHPGEEGSVFVNGSTAYELPANAGWDNLDGTGELEVLADVVPGVNVVEFGAGTFAGGTFYRIGSVQLIVEAEVESCTEPPPPLLDSREIHYSDATYTEREHWVHRCEGFDYAFTARGDEQIPLDCGGLYQAGGPRTGTATFLFEDLAAATYEIQIRSRHTENRNPVGALFVVDGEARRIPQDDDADFTTDVWGTKDLAGAVEVVLDSTQEDESDSVIWVRLIPQ